MLLLIKFLSSKLVVSLFKAKFKYKWIEIINIKRIEIEEEIYKKSKKATSS